MRFNQKLLLTDEDVTLLKHTSLTQRTSQIIKQLEQSVSIKDVLFGLEEIER